MISTVTKLSTIQDNMYLKYGEFYKQRIIATNLGIMIQSRSTEKPQILEVQPALARKPAA